MTKNIKGHYRPKGIRPSKQTREKIKLSKIGEKNPAWKGDKATLRAARRRTILEVPASKGTERHHKDGNEFNNAPENVEYLTRREHMIKDGRLSCRDSKGKFKKRVN